MSFMNYDFVLTACQHHQELAKHAADLQLEGRSSRPHRSKGSLRRLARWSRHSM
jgi:hypothetical protein